MKIMKKTKILTVILICCMAIMTAISVSAHDGLSYVEWGTPIIDGIKDDLWNDAQMIEVKSIESGEDIPEQDVATAKVWTLWDGDFLYVYAEVSDSVVEAEEKESIWDQDALGLMIDYSFYREPSESYRDLDDAERYAGYVNISPIAAETDKFFPEAATIFGLDNYQSKTQTYCRITDYGYVVEAALPLIYKQYVAGDRIGFEIFINNGIGNGNREGIVTWGIGGIDSWQFSESMGTLVFNEKPAVVVEVEEQEPIANTDQTEASPTEASPTENTESNVPQTGDTTTIYMIVTAAVIAFAVAANKFRIWRLHS